MIYYKQLEFSAPVAQLDRVADFESETLLVSSAVTKILNAFLGQKSGLQLSNNSIII